MRYLQRDEIGNVIGHYANPQEFRTELVEDDHPDLVAWNASRMLQPGQKSTGEREAELLARLSDLEARYALLESEVANLKGSELRGR